MGYNKDLLKSWLNEDKDYLEDYSEEDISDEELALFHIRNCVETNRRIEYCKKLLTRHQDAFIYYTLASLYRTYDFDPEGNLLYKKAVRYYCIMAIRKDRNYASAWALLAEAYHWVSLVVEETNTAWDSSEEIRYIEKALYCVKKSIQIEPMNEEYQNLLKYFYGERNDIYGAEIKNS